MGAYTRRAYTAEFKAEAVKRAMESNDTRTVLAGELGIGEGVLSRWVREHKRDELKQAVMVRNGEITKERRGYVRRNDGDSGELRQLREQVAKLTEERDALKRALSHYMKV